MHSKKHTPPYEKISLIPKPVPEILQKAIENQEISLSLQAKPLAQIDLLKPFIDSLLLYHKFLRQANCARCFYGDGV